MFEHRSPWQAFSPTDVFAALSTRKDLRIEAIEGRSFLLLQGRGDNAPLREALLQELNLQAPRPRTTTFNEANVLLWLGPNEWLLELPTPRATATLERLNARLGGTSTAITDLSESFAGLELAGEHAVDMLMSGCSLDLRPESFGADGVARTAVAGITAIVRKSADSTWRVLLDRSEAAYFLSWLQEAATEW